jgi:hypothetical protein
MNKIGAIKLLYLVYSLLLITGSAAAQSKGGELLISFQHSANGKPLVLKDSSYTNSFNENYNVTRLKYYISNIHFDEHSKGKPIQNIFLMDAAEEDTVHLQVPAGTYRTLYFTLGVDSILNCSGAQDGALDPLNGMFWTWNSGYIFFKLEGFSSSSAADLNRIEHHIGGYRGPDKAGRTMVLLLEKPLVLKENDKHQVNVRLNLDRYWESVNDIKINDNPVVMIPGEGAKRSADNFKAMFSVISVQ